MDIYRFHLRGDHNLIPARPGPKSVRADTLVFFILSGLHMFEHVPEAEFLDVIGTKAKVFLRVFLLAIHSQLY